MMPATIDDATHIFRERGEAANPGRLWAPYWCYLRPKKVHSLLVRHSRRHPAGQEIVRSAPTGPGCRTAEESTLIVL